ncbi:hypothetical protein LSH36_1295g00002, partial [Paralvinella palmiformis]
MLSRRFRRVKWLTILGFSKHRDVINKWRGWGLTSLLFIGLAFLISLQPNNIQDEDNLMIYSHHSSRRLLTTDGNETSKCEYEENHLPIAWVISHCICTLIIFIALAIICDDFFVPSLEIISEKLNLSEDVAGATFMAAGSSAPELFTSVAGVAQKTDVGVGTIVGSAVFNLLIIIALTAALAGKVLHLDWRPLIRDSFFYAMSIGCFIGFSWDGYFQHYEAAILLSLYVLYIVIMIFNAKLVAWMGTWEKCCKKPEVSPTEDGEKPNDLQTQLNHIEAKGAEGRRNSNVNRDKVAASGAKITDQIKKQEDEDEEEQEETMQICPCCPCCPPVRTYPPSSLNAREKGGFLNWLKLILRWIIFIPAFPFVCLFSWTIPECSKEHLRKYYLLSFFMSVAWIAALSYAMVTVVERTGCILGVDSYIMGLVVVAIGTSVPDAMSSILVARDGYGDMAVSNAIGSNVFDINLGLGLPFIIRIAIDKGAPIALLESSEWVAHFSGKMIMTPHSKFGFILLLILFLCLLIFVAVRFRLN